MSHWEFSRELDALKRQQLYRSRLTLSGPQGAQVQIEGELYDNFSSNDYLGLAHHPEVINAFQQAAQQYGVGSGSAHLICGHSLEHQAKQAHVPSQ